jgi:hypothetical protein
MVVACGGRALRSVPSAAPTHTLQPRLWGVIPGGFRTLAGLAAVRDFDP